MHKGNILLVKSNDKESALEKVNEFLEPYGNGKEWDWFAIGGRWHNSLAPKEKKDSWNKKAESILPKREGGMIYSSDVETFAAELQEAWESEGLNGNNPHYSNYKLPEDGDYYDVIPLHDCIDTVKGWVKDIAKEKNKLWDKMVEARNEEVEKNMANNHGMTGYFAGEYYDLDYGKFCFESNVYNITREEAETIPENITGYFAIMVDLHN